MYVVVVSPANLYATRNVSAPTMPCSRPGGGRMGVIAAVWKQTVPIGAFDSRGASCISRANGLTCSFDRAPSGNRHDLAGHRASERDILAISSWSGSTPQL